jgi:peroxiredoxin
MLVLGSASKSKAEIVELKGKVIQLASGMPATAILHSTADESYVGTANIDKDGNFSFKVDVPKAGQFNIRIMRLSYDVMLSAAEEVTNLTVKFDGDVLKDIEVEKSPENEAYKTFKTLVNLYDTKIIAHFRFCDKEDSCERTLHTLLTEYAHELSLIQQNFKGTYTADVLCKMKMPVVTKNVKNTTEEFRKGFFENVDFSDSTIFSTTVYRDMIAGYVDYIIDATSISKENQFVTYFTDKIKANPMVLHKSASMFFEELIKGQREKMLTMFINWYNAGDNKEAVNHPVLDVRVKNVSKVMPGQPFIDVSAPDTGGTVQSLKAIVDRSKCTLLLFWSSDCSHCRDEMPFIKEYYEKYHSKGLGIYAISLESDPEKWKKFVEDKNLTWTNVISSQRADPNPAIQYMSVSTPTMVLIDSKGNIIHRFMPKTRLEAHIIEALK